MDKNRVVTFGSLGGLSAPSSLTNIVNTGGYLFKGYCTTAGTNNLWMKYVYYGYAAGDGNGRYYVPVINDNNTTYGHEAGLYSSGFRLEELLEGIGIGSGGAPVYVRYNQIAGFSERSPKIDAFTLFKKDENGELIEALDENGDPIYYAEEHIDNLDS